MVHWSYGYLIGLVILYNGGLVSSVRHHTVKKRSSGSSGDLLSECPKDTIPAAAKNVPTYQFTFDDDVHQSIDLHWIGKDSKTMIMLSSTSVLSPFGRMYGASSLWRSTDGGRYYQNITSQIDADPISVDHGLILSTVDRDMAILVAAAVMRRPRRHLYVTRNAGATWSRVYTPFRALSLRCNAFAANLILADSAVDGAQGRNGTLYLSTDYGFTWKLVMGDVKTYEWGPSPKTVFVSVADRSNKGKLKLIRTDDLFKTYRSVASDVYRFVIVDSYLFASVYTAGGSRSLYVSKMTGKSADWQLSRLPEAQDTGVFYILDAADGMVLVHVDTEGHGHGSIFVSDSSGVYYSKALDGHIQTGKHSDFYRVKSMRGTFITSVAVAGSENLLGSLVASRISFDRGARWQRIEIENCDTDGSDCSLHIHGMLSMRAGVIRQLPASDAGAPGLIIAHGNKGHAHSTNVDIYITLDGGYKWRKVLEGPHFYAIADQGKLLVAVPISKNHTADTIYFSENHGECWSQVTFSTVPWHFTGMEGDPKALGLKVTLWGYTPSDGLWQTMEVDFSAVVERQCTSDDYDEWLPHAQGARDGCLMGYKETFDVVKPHVWCAVPDEAGKSRVEPCPCTLEDLECDFGFVWNAGNTECVVDKTVPSNLSRAMLCAPGQKVYNSSIGYRRIPGDKCVAGDAQRFLKFSPKTCVGHVPGDGPHGADGDAAHRHKSASVVVVVILSLISVAVLAYVIYKFVIPRRKGRYNYSYSALRTDQEEASDTEGAAAGAAGAMGTEEDDVRIVKA